MTFFYGYNAFGCIYILVTFKNNNKKNSVYQLLCFGDTFLNGISPDFCKKPRNVHFDLNSVFSLSYKISFTNLRSLFIERITYILNIIYSNNNNNNNDNNNKFIIVRTKLKYVRCAYAHCRLSFEAFLDKYSRAPQIFPKFLRNSFAIFP